MRLAAPLVAGLAALAANGPAAAQETGSSGLAIELNAAEDTPQGCTLSFLLTNGGGADIDRAVFETVLFDAGGQVDRLTLFDFGALPAGRPRVRQFTLADTPCEGIARLLVNGVETCEAGDAAPAACTEGLTLGSRTDIEVTG